MYRTVLLWLCLFLASAGAAAAKDNAPAAKAAAKAAPKQEAQPAEAKELSGMSIVGNDEAPKALYIVPWKSSEIGNETRLNLLLNAGDMPVDREVFLRQLEFYELSIKK